MSISKRGRRKLIVGDRLFLWSLDHQYGCHWREFEPPAIRILSDDKALEVFYQIRQLRTGASVLEIVRGVGSVPDAVYPRLTVHIPLEEDEEPTPGLVRRIIDWCLDPPDRWQAASLTLRPMADDAMLADLLQRQVDARRLRSLVLSGTQITDEGLEALRSLQSLRWLYLLRTRITDEGLPHLKTLASLRSLWLGETAVTPAGVKQLAKCLPKCLIHI